MYVWMGLQIAAQRRMVFQVFLVRSERWVLGKLAGDRAMFTDHVHYTLEGTRRLATSYADVLETQLR